MHTHKLLILTLILAVACLASGCRESSAPPRNLSAPPVATSRGDEILANAFRTGRSNIQVAGEGVVASVLPDDTKGDRHQRFLLQLRSGQTILVAHNIDLAPRIPNLKKGDKVQFQGEYEWNDKGGVIHWTHRDPRGRHPAGWLKHQGRIYQ